MTARRGRGGWIQFVLTTLAVMSLLGAFFAYDQAASGGGAGWSAGLGAMCSVAVTLLLAAARADS